MRYKRWLVLSVHSAAGLLSIALMLAFVLMGMGCGQPRVPMPDPGTRMFPAGTPVTSDQLTSALAAEQKRMEAEQKAEELRVKRELRQIQREAETLSASALTKAQDKAEEVAENAVISSEERQAKLAALASTVAQAQADIEARQSFVHNLTQLASVGLSNSGLPGGGLAASLLVGVGGLLWGSKKSGDARSERAASTAHDEAWEESKKELMAMIAQMRGIEKP